MKKAIIIILLLVFAATTPSYAVSIIDTVLCKSVVLNFNNGTTVLVNRVTGEVKYAMNNGQYVPVKGMYKDRLQAIYDAQRARKRPH